MAALTVRNVDNAVKANARLAAARNGRSLEAEVRALLERTYRPVEDDRAARIRTMTGHEFVQHLIKVANGAMVYVRDVAQVRDGSPPQTNIVHVDGNRSVLMVVLKSGGVSTLSIIDGVKKKVEEKRG